MDVGGVLVGVLVLGVLVGHVSDGGRVGSCESAGDDSRGVGGG